MAVSTVDRRPGNLPADLTSFVGRRREIADVKNRLSGSRLVTLTGMGGVGKTRLALSVAWQVRRGFPDGVWLVELAGLRDPALVGQTLATSLGLHDHSAGSLPGLAHLLAERQMMIVLDNCEHLLDACAVLADSVLRACPGVRILATSRQPLGIGGELLVAVSPLSAPEPGRGTSPEGLARYEAVDLFVERANAVQPGFRLDSANHTAVAGICRRLDGIPLAIELAAGRLRALSVDELMARLDDRYALLTGGSRAALPRQQTLRALIDWSFELCSDAERLVWARLSVFAGGFDLGAAEQVCSDEVIRSDLVWDVVTHLVDKSIVVAADDTDGVRYQLPETLREYGRDRLLEFEAIDEFRARHRDWCEELIARVDAGWFGGEQVSLFARLRREHANLREALSFCLGSSVEAEVGLRMASGLRFYWGVSGRLKEGRHWLGQLLAMRDEPDSARLMAVCVDAYLATVLGDFTAVASLLDEAGTLADRLDDWSGAVLVTQISGLSELFQNDPARAGVRFEAALSAHRQMGDEPAATYDQVELALCAALLGESDRATGLLEDCLEVTQSRGEHWLRALTLWALGIEHCKDGDHQRAAALETESLRLRLAMNDRWTISLNIQVLGWAAVAAGDSRRGARLLGASEKIADSVGLSPVALGHLVDLRKGYEDTARRNLTDEAFEQAAEEGRQLTFDDAVRLALGERATATGRVTAVSPARPWGPLTKRESEIAELVRRGMSNKDIAAALVISQRTAETHVEHILTKLGLTSRTQVAAWVNDSLGQVEDIP